MRGLVGALTWRLDWDELDVLPLLLLVSWDLFLIFFLLSSLKKGEV